MKDFESFKASREQMDPSTCKMSAHQWEQAYDAYRRAREMVSTGGGKKTTNSGKRRKHRSHSGGRGSHRPSSLSELTKLRHHIREQSAYTDLRLIVDVLAWIVIAIVAIAGLIPLAFYTSMPALLVTMLGAAVQIIVVILVRLLVQVLIDIPDVGLYRAVHELRLPSHSEEAVDDVEKQ